MTDVLKEMIGRKIREIDEVKREQQEAKDAEDWQEAENLGFVVDFLEEVLDDEIHIEKEGL